MVAASRSAEDQHVRTLVAGVDRGLDPRHRLGALHHLHAAGEAAALGQALVLDHHRGEAGPGIARHRALDVERIAVAGVTVSDHRNRHRRADVPPLVEHLAERDQAGVGGGDPCGGDRQAAHEGNREPGPLHDARADRVMASGQNDQAGLGQKLSQSFGPGAHWRAFRPIAAGAWSRLRPVVVVWTGPAAGARC